MSHNLKKTLLAAAAGVAAAVGGHAAVSADSVEVQSGDTLNSIAQKNNTTVDDVAKANGITDTNLIIAGQKLNISTPEAPSVSADGSKYTVQAGDSLSKISETTGVSIATLTSLNNLSNHDFVLTGQELSLQEAPKNQNTAETVTATEQAPVAAATDTEKVAYIAAADTDKNGFMTTAEYDAYQANGGQVAAAEKAQTVTAQPAAQVSENVTYNAAADANHDGYMTAAEYSAYQANGGNKQAPAAVQPATTQAQASTQQSAPTQVSTNNTSAPSSSAAQTMLNSLNAKRASLGLAPVTLDAGLSAHAQSRAANAVANGGIPTNHFSTNGEVVAVDFGAGQVIDAWYNETNMTTNGTPGHRMWVANARATSVGFGIVGGTIVAESNAGQY
ncbi:LysM peptidoglycan-binding domain-containing protein [Leuconostoc carnosum]|uniref:LysM peptidoglycan-binding domain-containing protein n=1 Tax=Leuconostoc TaxID=1243 RepID=UPI000D5197F4|nr:MULTISPECIES: LysM peptidoglycan-binding domain-containing protein [Leuconostoc]KAA8324882.1 LysM peptidoglycan-binding domain-containing protein [Leuconostoc carnosum]KAA8358818.1 LysM peptidoglycan-binding domain-containing protein [Leuconostoc carnosum]KAA8364988.1 LysM peptidoglycan-binding domain-containing protein [Leuconostoc carnosum]KAA8365736.1 LysM peptidoglycan-binding domain-containing protein [Leuconostoc carnosum]KAA8371959.1 LysM peptidoglycan-binding domain-containing prote